MPRGPARAAEPIYRGSPPRPAEPIYRGSPPRPAPSGTRPPQRDGYREHEPFGNNATARPRTFVLPSWLARRAWPPHVRISWPDDLTEPIDVEELTGGHDHQLGSPAGEER